jgi:5-methylcytosine-specific restriction endonuclease McrA
VSYRTIVACPDCGSERLAGDGDPARPSRVAAEAARAYARAAAVAARRADRSLKTLDAHRCSSHSDGLSARCRSCDRAAAASYYRANKERRSRRWAVTNPERRREVARLHSRRFRRAHPERARARKDRTDFEAIIEEHGLVCHICGDAITAGDLHFDHVIPLSRVGAHSRENIRPAHARCNLRKGTLLMEELAR